MSIHDFCTSADYAALLEQRRAGRLTPRELADAFADRGEMYHAYTWYLIAGSLGDADAETHANALHDLDHVCDEDVYLADLQIAIWFQRGIVIDENHALALRHLSTAVLPLLDFPPLDQVLDAVELESERKKVWDDALRRFGFPNMDHPVDAPTVARLVEHVLSVTAWPASLDFTMPLGPSAADRPHWLHPRHAIEQ